LHTHNLPMVNETTERVIAKDAALAQDRGTARASFQGRFRKTTFGDFKNRVGLSPELSEAQLEDHEREDAKAALAMAALEAGVVLEVTAPTYEDEQTMMSEIDLHKLADGGPVHE